MIEMQHQGQLTEEQGGKIVASGVGNFVGKNGPALVERPGCPIRGQNNDRPTPADCGRSDQSIRLTNIDRTTAAKLGAKYIDKFQHFAVEHRLAAISLPSHGQHA